MADEGWQARGLRIGCWEKDGVNNELDVRTDMMVASRAFQPENILKTCFVLMLGAFVCFHSEAANASCVSRNWNLSSEGPWPGYGTVKAGHSCVGRFYSYDNMMFSRLYLVEAPKHGSVQLREGGSYKYTPSPNYSGPDTFMLRVCGKLANTDRCSNLINNMTVQ